MRPLIVLLMVWALPSAAADYSTWKEPPAYGVEGLIQLAERGSRCCRHCTKGQPCGDSCISTKDKCRKPPGCAC